MNGKDKYSFVSKNNVRFLADDLRWRSSQSSSSSSSLPPSTMMIMTIIDIVQILSSGLGPRQGSHRSESPEATELEGGRDTREVSSCQSWSKTKLYSHNICNDDVKVDQEQDPAQRGGADLGEHQLRGWFCLRYQAFSLRLLLDLIIWNLRGSCDVMCGLGASGNPAAADRARQGVHVPVHPAEEGGGDQDQDFEQTNIL